MLLPWYQSGLTSAEELPEFVPSLFSIPVRKGAQAWTVRMETPVLYFYAEEATDLDVRVGTQKIAVTEAYPVGERISTESQTGLERSAGVQSSWGWKVRILPPDDAVGKLMPKVGERGAHYAEARAVPDAWWVEAQGIDPVDGTKRREVEKFIFYRGAGAPDMIPRGWPIGDHKVMMRRDEGPAYLIRVGKDGLHWRKEAPREEEKQENGIVMEPGQEDGLGVEALVQELEVDLARAGLTEAEAAAMVATWRTSWLEEEGLRILEVLPRALVDAVLPLQIRPQPSKLKRVFVGRWELMTREMMARIEAEMESGQEMEVVVDRLQELRLGRFWAAAMELLARERDRSFRMKTDSLVNALQTLQNNENSESR